MTGTHFRNISLGLLIFLLVIASYTPALRSGFVWDDNYNVVNNQVLTESGGLFRIWTDLRANEQYYPLTHTSFWIERRVYGLRPFGYHLDNVLLHAGSAVLLWRILLLLGIQGAWFAAGVFALHPVHVESVAWVTERKNALSGLFMMLSIYYFLRSHLWRESSLPTRIGLSGYVFSLVFFLAALLSKTAVCLLPFGFATMLWWKKGSIVRRNFRPLAPFFALGAGFGLLTAFLEKSHVGAAGSVFDWSFATRLLIAGRAFWFYIYELFWPANLVFIRPRWEIREADPLAWIYPLATLFVVLALVFFRKRTGRGPLAAVLWFFVMIFPALGFFNVYFMRYAFVQDHFQYYASISIIAFVSGSVAWWWEKTGRGLEGGAIRVLGIALQLIVLAPLGWLTWHQCLIYENEEILWKDTLSKNPDAFVARSNYGLMLFNRGDLSTALVHQREALRLYPGPDEYENLGNTLDELGRTEEALTCYREALKRRPTASLYTNLGIALFRSGRRAEAIAYYRMALKMDTNFALAHYNLGLDLMKQGSIAEALPSLREALRLIPGNPDTHQNLGVALSRMGLQEEAQRHLSEAKRLRRTAGHSQ